MRNSEQYVIEYSDNEEDKTEPGIYAYLMVAQGQALEPVHQVLQSFSAAQSHPLVWPDLLAALGEENILERQLGISKKYNL